MSVGPIELLAVKFPGTRFTSDIIQVLDELVARGTIRIVDLVFATRSPTGEVRVLDPGELGAESVAALDPLVEDILGLLSEEDVVRMGTRLPNGSSAGLLLFENVWATRFSEAVTRARGGMQHDARIPPRRGEALLASARGPVPAGPVPARSPRPEARLTNTCFQYRQRRHRICATTRLRLV